jgi:hypothetical protein
MKSHFDLSPTAWVENERRSARVFGSVAEVLRTFSPEEQALQARRAFLSSSTQGSSSVPRNVLLTVAQVANVCGVSERTVRADIRAGVLRVRGRGRSVRVTGEEARKYRRGRYASDRLLTLQQISECTQLSIRTLRRRVAAGFIATVRVSPRRLYVRLEDAENLPEWWIPRCETDRPSNSLTLAPSESFVGNRSLVRPREFAKLAGISLRQVYGDIRKGALERFGTEKRALLQRSEALQYALENEPKSKKR